MKRLRAVAVFASLYMAVQAMAQTVPSALNYQGRLLNGSNLVNGAVGLSLRIFTAPVGGTRLYEDSNSVSVVDGLYSTAIGDDTTFGSLTNALANPNAYLETMINGVALAPRERITASAYALIAGGLASGVVAPENMQVAAFSNTFWKLDGNAGTIEGTHVLGTSDNKPLNIVVNNTRAMRLEPGAPSPNVVGGHPTNSAAGAAGATIGGGGEPGGQQRVTSNFGTIGGGSGNKAAGVYSTVAGGAGNVANAGAAFVGGGYTNSTGLIALGATIAGGSLNNANGVSSFIGGGQNNSVGVQGQSAVISGGTGNSAMSTYSTISGGNGNIASNQYVSIGGGVQNTAGGQGAVIGGGSANNAPKDYATIAGGNFNTARGPWSTVGGGYGNAASNYYSTVAGGFDCSAGGYYSFAAGNRAKANHNGAFVFGDSNTAYIVSTNDNSWTVRCTGGARFISSVDGSGNPTAGVILGKGGGAWDTLSDRGAKANFEPVDSRVVLEKVAQMPVTTWNMKSQDPSIRHMGPMAQDFREAFGLGSDERHITSSDADGVALAAIQGLYEIVREQRAEIEVLKRELDALRGRDASATSGPQASDAISSPGS